MRKTFKLGLLGCFLAGFAVAASAGTDTTTFQVKITITESCDIHTTAATDVDFGSVARSATASQATGALNVNCTNGTAYSIGLNNGANYNTTRRMTDGTNFIGYGLYRSSGTTQPWDDASNLYSGTGTGSTQSVSVYGTVSGSTNVPAGSYADTVTATVTY